MLRIVSVLARVALLAAVIVGAASPALANKRVALVIGNANYASTPMLANPRNDAEDIAALLRELGFEVLLELDIDKRGMDIAFARFARAAQDADAALFYYAGHGIQREGRNFLMPVDAKVEDDISIRFEMVGLDAARDALAGVSGLKIMVIDACRNNPVAERLQSRAASRGAMFNLGLANEQVRGTVVVYATQPNNVAADGAGRNSPFTLAFIEQAREPGLRVADMLTRVADSVSRATSGRQVPEFTASGGGQFVLNARETDTQIWQRVREGSRDQIAAFLTDHPRSVHADDARLRLETMDRPSADPAERRARAEADAAARTALAEQNARLEQLQQQLAAMQQEMERRAREAGQATERARVAVGRRARERERAEEATARAQQERLQRTRDAATREAEARLARERRLAERAEAREADARRAREREAAAQATIRELEERLQREREAAAQVAARQAEERSRREREAAAQAAARQAEERARREREASVQAAIREAEERSRRERMAAAGSSGAGPAGALPVIAPTQTETRLALVLGVGSYRSNPLPNALNNAGLMAQTLRDLGFSTIEGADLPQADLRAAIANFMAKARQAGPDSILLVYLAGLGLQHEGDSYLIPSDAAIERESDVPIMGLRLVDLARALGSVQSRARLLLLDLSADHPWAGLGLPVRRGLGVFDAAPGLLIASAVAPGEVMAPFEGAYGRFALALAEQLRAPGLPLDEAIARARLRVHQQSNGRDTPWEASRLPPPVRSLTLPADPMPTGSTLPPAAARRIEGLPVADAYALAVERDSIAGYQEFLRAYPTGPFTRRVLRLLAAKREAMVWRQTLRVGSPQSYWTYLKIYPRGPHAEEARWGLGRLQAPIRPSQDFVEVIYEDIPPPLWGVEIVDDPAFWVPAPPAFYDNVVLAPAHLGPPLAPIWALPPPPAYSWGVLPVAAAAAIVSAPFILPRTLRRPDMPVVLRPPPGGPRPMPRPGLPGAGAPVLGSVGGAVRPLPGAPGGGRLPRPGTDGPVIQRPVGPAVQQDGRPAGRPGMHRPGRRPGPVVLHSRRPDFQPRPQIQRPGSRPSRPIVERPSRPVFERPSRPVFERPSRPAFERPSRPSFRPMGPSRPSFRMSGPSRPFFGGRR
ncbi:caspase family protein [Phreatobacter stygius]|uniref:Caspase family p20 domain-containing protein n=1 Tax=Phreatobacter stygius TaxID=1940610 RepID=A0A4D7AVK3_9HYPH|nr:caspase family protein [Phreatobacter stygius]QCI63595.1 hypothetical protein E8M01_04675 [Phreatobacter stygius]